MSMRLFKTNKLCRIVAVFSSLLAGSLWIGSKTHETGTVPLPILVLDLVPVTVFSLYMYHCQSQSMTGKHFCHTVTLLLDTIVCLIIIVNIIFSGYFKYYITYDHFFFTVRFPCHTALPDPKSSSYVHYLVKY